MAPITAAGDPRLTPDPRRDRGSRRRAGPGDRPRRRRRDQVHRDPRRRRQVRRRVQARRVRHRALAAGEDRVLRLRPEPRAHRVRDRQHRGARHRSRRHLVLARRRAGRRPRRPRSDLPRGRRPARDEAGRDRRARATLGAARPPPPCGRATSRTTTCRSTPTTAPEHGAGRPPGTDRARRRRAGARRGAAAAAQYPIRTGRRSPPRAGASKAAAATCRAIAHPHAIRLDDLVAVDEQKHAIDRNTKQFVAGLPANNVLLTGSRGTGKSSLVKAMLAKYAARGLRLIEVDKGDLVDLPDIADRVAGRPERFVVFCDDLTFDAGESGYRALKVMLDGSIAGGAANVAHLRDVEPPSHAARVFQREPRDAARRRGSASRRVGRGEDLAVRALRAVDLVLSVRARTTTSRRSPAGSRISASSRPASARDARGAHAAKRCNGRSRAARAAAAWRGSSRRTTPATTCSCRQSVERRTSSASRRPSCCARDGAVLLAQRPAGKPYAGYWEFPGGKLEPGETPREALARELREELGIDGAPRRPVARPGIRLSARARRAPFLPRVRVGRRTRRARRAGVRVAGAGPLHGRAAPAGQHAHPRGARAAAGLRHHLRGRHRRRRRSSRAPNARSTAACALIQLREKDWPAARRDAFALRLVPLAHRFGAQVLLERHAPTMRADWDATACTGRPRCWRRHRSGRRT